MGLTTSGGYWRNKVTFRGPSRRSRGPLNEATRSAASSVGILLEHDGDLDGALAAYRKASEAGDADGSLNLGALLAGTGDPTGAVSAYQKAIQHGDEVLSRRARTALAALQANR